jgi:phage-related protein
MNNKRIPADFYQTASGREPVREWLKELEKKDRYLIGSDIKTVEIGWPIGMPTCRHMGDGLYEVRTDLTNRRISRVFFCIHEERMVLLHAIIKKTKKTPQQDLDLALRRKQEVEAER